MEFRRYEEFLSQNIFFWKLTVLCDNLQIFYVNLIHLYSSPAARIASDI